MKNKMKSLKAGVLMIALLASSTTITLAQKDGPPPPRPKDKRAERHDERKENIETLKIGFLTKRLDLTPEEAQKFWPVYNQFSDKLQDIRKKRREDFRDAKQKFEDLSDKEMEQAVDTDMANRQKELDIQKEYHAKFKAVLPIKKVARLYAAEEQFKMELLNKLRDRERERGNKDRNPPPPPPPGE